MLENGTLLTVTDENFATEIEGSKGLAMVDFWAVWCGPCRRLGPVLEELAAQYAGRLKVVKVDAERDPQLAQRYRVMSMPTVLGFRGGQPVAQMVGFGGRRRVEKLFEELVA